MPVSFSFGTVDEILHVSSVSSITDEKVSKFRFDNSFIIDLNTFRSGLRVVKMRLTHQQKKTRKTR